MYPDPKLTNTLPEPSFVTWNPVDSSKLIPVTWDTTVLVWPPLPLILLTVKLAVLKAIKSLPLEEYRTPSAMFKANSPGRIYEVLLKFVVLGTRPETDVLLTWIKLLAIWLPN